MLVLKRIAHALLLGALLSLTGCFSFNTYGPIGEPDKAATVTSPRVAQMADVVVSVPKINDELRKNVSRQLTEQINHYIESAGYFKDLSVFPARLGDQDVMLKFNLTSLHGKRSAHPAYFPGALLTLTIYIWVNGPIYVDTYDLAGELTIEDRTGKTLAKSIEKVDEPHNVGLYDADYAAPGLGSRQLRDLIAKLTDAAVTQLNAH
jgi:hypothetical protein